MMTGRRSSRCLAGLTLAMAFAGVPSHRQGEMSVMDLKNATIVVTPDAIASERFTAEEFQRFFEQESGTRTTTMEWSRDPLGSYSYPPPAVRAVGTFPS